MTTIPAGSLAVGDVFSVSASGTLASEWPTELLGPEEEWTELEDDEPIYWYSNLRIQWYGPRFRPWKANKHRYGR